MHSCVSRVETLEMKTEELTRELEVLLKAVKEAERNLEHTKNREKEVS